MKDHYDPWFVRLPDGRTIKAKSTASVRHHIEAGHIPLNSLVRRDTAEEWVSLVWVAEFADLGGGIPAPNPTLSHTGTTAPARSGVAARLDPLRLQTVGVRGLIDELIAALDSALARSKMVPAFAAAVLLYLGVFGIRAGYAALMVPPDSPADAVARSWVPVVAGAGWAVLVMSVLNGVLARLTHLELSAMRPARLRDALSPAGYLVPVVLANVLVAGAALGLLAVLEYVPDWTRHALDTGGLAPAARDAIYVLARLAVEVLSVWLWIVVGLCWLLSPAIVVEESSWLRGVREWRQLVREHFGRVVVYEGLTILLGVAVALPVTLAVGLAVDNRLEVLPALPAAGDGWVDGPVRAVVSGLPAAPLLALLAVANVFIYLNLRYEQSPGR